MAQKQKMTRRIVSLWFPKLGIDRLARRMRHDWDKLPVVVIAETGNRVFVTDLNTEAEQAGITPGMALADARTLSPGLITHPADPAADAVFLNQLARWCRRFTPVVALEPPDGLYLDVTGCARLYKGEANLMAAIASETAGLGLTARLGLADTPGAARAIAHYGKSGTIAAPGKAREAIQELSVAALRLDGDTVATLKRLGLDRIGSLYPLASASLAKRFGEAALTRLRQALGIVPEPLDPLPFTPPFVARMGFAEPIALSDDVKAALDILIARLCKRLERERLGCRRLVFTLHRVDNSSQSIAAGTSEPVARPEHLTFLIEEHLDTLDAGFGIERAEVRMPVVEPRNETSLSFSEGAQPVALPALLDRLGNRIGFDKVLRFSPADSHIPERAFIAHTAVHPAAYAGSGARVWPKLTRPTRLLARPQLLDAVTDDGFTLHGRQHRIVTREGPERITPEWWWDDPAWGPAPRDYWSVADEDGRRFWIYRTLKPSHPPHPFETRWYLHGLFQ